MRSNYLTYLLLLTCYIFTTYNQKLIAQDDISPNRETERNNYRRQTAKNQFYLGSSFGLGIGFQNYSLAVANSTPIADGVLNPKIGFFPINRLLIGGTMDYSLSLAISEGQSNYEVHTQTFGTFARYYVTKTLFLEGQYGWGTGKEIKNEPSTKQAFSAQRYSVGFGVAHFWAKRISFELMMRYSGAKGTGLDVDSNTIHLSNLGITAGIGYVIGKDTPKNTLAIK